MPPFGDGIPPPSCVILELLYLIGVYTGSKSMSTSAVQKPAHDELRQLAWEGQVLPTLFGEGQGLYPQRKETFVYSFIIHMVAVGVLIWSGHWVFEHKDELKQQVIGVVTDISPYLPM